MYYTDAALVTSVFCWTKCVYGFLYYYLQIIQRLEDEAISYCRGVFHCEIEN
jgi:hypothetical protein